MKVKILSYQIHRGYKVRVQSHNKRKGKWKVNPNFEYHQSIANGDGTYEAGYFPIIYKKLVIKELE